MSVITDQHMHAIRTHMNMDFLSLKVSELKDVDVHALLYCMALISRVFIFANFANFELFAKIISAKILTATVRYMSSMRVREIISKKFQKKATHEKLDLQNISAIQ